MRASDLVKNNIAYHDSLEPTVWQDEDTMNMPVRYRLLQIAKLFMEYLDVPNFKLVDVVLRGSLTNYNYTTYSDFDLHLVTDFSTIDCEALARNFYDAKKKLWNDAHNIYIKGYEVELYVEDVNDTNASLASYSVLDNRWLTKPVYDKPSVDQAQVERKALGLIDDITVALEHEDIEEIQRLKDKIKNMRKSGLESGGEYSTENLVFKILRNQGYIKRLMDTHNQAQDERLSLAELAEEKDACYHKVKSRYKVWPSAYASGALSKCRKVGAKNWGNKSKK